jgi:uncharacterized protein
MSSPSGALCVPVVELRRRVGSRRPFSRSVVLDVPPVAGTRVPPGAPVAFDLVLESVLEGVMVSGEVRAPWVAECRRCLEPVEGVVTVEVRELFEPDHTPGETYPIEEDHIDLEPMTRDAVLLSLPLSPLCREDCRGPDPERFPTTVEAEEAAEEPVGDERWAALRELRFED